MKHPVAVQWRRNVGRGLTSTLAGALLITLGLVGSGSGAVALQGTGCEQPSEDGCALSFDLPESAVLDDPATQHVWRVFVPGASGLRVTLSLPAAFRFYVYAPDGELLSPVSGEGAIASLEMQPSMPGFYAIVIDSPGGQISRTPYVIEASRMEPPVDAVELPATELPPTATPAPSPPTQPRATAVPAAPTTAPTAVPLPAPTTASLPSGLASAEGSGLRVTIISVQRPYLGDLPPSGSEHVLLRVRLDNIGSSSLALLQWSQAMTLVDATGATRNTTRNVGPDRLSSAGTLLPSVSKEGNTIFYVPIGSPAIVAVVWEIGTQRIVVSLPR